MKYIGRIQETTINVNDKYFNIYIEKFHRYAVGSKSNSKLYFLPKVTTDISNSKRNKLREIILSPFPPAIWNNIFRLKFRVEDKNGVTAFVFKVLSELDLEIIIQESIMVRYENLFTISLVVSVPQDFVSVDFGNEKDIENYLNTKREKIEEKINELYNKEKKRLFPSLSDKPPYVKKIELLNIHFLEYKYIKENKKLNEVNNEQLDKYFKPGKYQKVVINNGNIFFDKEIFKILGVNFEKNKKIEYTINSDTEEKYMLIRFFEENQYIIHLDIVHNGLGVGILSKFAKELKEKNYNIINSYNRIDGYKYYDHKKNNASLHLKSHWIVMFDISENPDNLEPVLKSIKNLDNSIDIRIINATNNLYQKHKRLLKNQYNFTKDPINLFIRKANKIINKRINNFIKNLFSLRINFNKFLYIIFSYTLLILLFLSLFLFKNYKYNYPRIITNYITESTNDLAIMVIAAVIAAAILSAFRKINKDINDK